jgi:pimeloyl-ACP methyl ester carboxylesterase
VFIEWIKPNAKESLEEYAVRLRQCITEPNPVVVGVSFGGMLASEMAKREPSLKAIIISSNKTSAEFPAYLRVGKYLPVYKWLPPKLVKATGRLTKNIVGPKGKEQKKVFLQILNDTDPKFTNWATDAILRWSNKVVPNNVVHIHGDADRLLPYSFVTCDYTIKKGTHLMIFDRAKELSDLLRQLIKE